MKRAVLVAIALATLFHLHRARVDAQVPPDTLTFFRNHFVTGDFVTRGDRNEASLRACAAQVDGIRAWDRGPQP